MAYTKAFKRSEIKYIITERQLGEILTLMADKMHPDDFGKSLICNVYFDTPDFLLIRRSIEKPIYKEKLRLRSYGLPTADSTVYLELKKKFKGVVFKRRMALRYGKLDQFLNGQDLGEDGQIEKEIRYALNYYKGIGPALFLSYERQAFYGNDDAELRITFDQNIIWRDYDLSLDKGVYGTPLLEKGTYLMEIKTDTAIPLWLSGFLSENRIFKQSFSKYGTAYTRLTLSKTTKSILPA